MASKQKADTETKFYNWIRKQITGAQFQRIETATTAGVPDVYMCHDGQSIWVELKIVRGNYALLRKEQYAWGIRHARHGGRAIVLARSGDEMFIWEFPIALVRLGGVAKSGKLRLDKRDAILVDGDLLGHIKGNK
jgi:hypothetical protein